MRPALLCVFIVLETLAAPTVIINEENTNQIASILPKSIVAGHAVGSLSYAADMSAPGNSQQFNCLARSGFNAVFLRGYSAAGEGTFDYNVITNLNLANAAGLISEVYMTPQIFSHKSGGEQLDEVYDGLTSKGFQVNSIWIQVVNPQTWSSNLYGNHNFLASITNRARYLRIAIGIYTSAFDWRQIMGSTYSEQDDVMLWYWSHTGDGENGETPENFNDYQQIGRWKYPTVKQYGQSVYYCYAYRNLDVYSPTFTLAAAEAKKNATMMIGRIGLKN